MSRRGGKLAAFAAVAVGALATVGAAPAGAAQAGRIPAGRIQAKTGESHAPLHRKNFRTSVYVVVNSTEALSDPKVFEHQFERAMRQVHFDKVYIEVYRDHNFASDAQIEAVKRFFQSKGVQVAGGITLAAGGSGGQFGTFDYEKPEDRAECERAARLAAKYFDEVVLDDFFFYNSKSAADIAAKGDRSWTQYRLETMRKVARDLVVGPAHAENPRVKMIVKYPNWFEHFQGLGFDLDQEPHIFDGIYTGTETRDPEITDQLLQEYESYEIIRYYDHIDPGHNGGGWVDTYSVRSPDRYAEQLWDTLFAKAPQIMLFNWVDVSSEKPFPQGERPWGGERTSFDLNALRSAYKPAPGGNDPGPGWGAVAGYALDKVDTVLGALGNPVGIPSYKPYQSTGEDFLQQYLGDIGLPIEMQPTYPTDADVVLLTEAAKGDPQIVAKIKQSLMAGHKVVITSGLLGALQGKGIEDVAEIWKTGRVAEVGEFLNGYGAGDGVSLNEPGAAPRPVLFPEVHFYTNDAWPIIRGVASDKGFPIMLMDRYGPGVLYVLTIPENQGALYELPQPLLTQIKTYLQGDDAPVRIDAPPRVSLFTYDNDTMVVESFRPSDTPVNVSVKGRVSALVDVATGERIAPARAEGGPPEAGARRRGPPQPERTVFTLKLPAHSFQALKVQREG